MTDWFFLLQQALYARLQADPGLKALLGDPVRAYDYVPPDPVFPYLTLGEMEARDHGAKGYPASTQLVTLHVWSRQRGSREVKQALSALRECLHDASFSISGLGLARCQEEFAATLTDPDGLTEHGIARYRMVVS